ncbi:hypothetical protein NT6N_39230 [Oceaniferula spumae]|uniref:Superoxide dismutase n=1 Tax=Oceaniferula spumae TaxID=2979115 RepID=A0AAT9FSB1_9BACT
MKTYLTIATAAVLSFAAVPNISAHCQIPCGIYTDDTVLKDLHTHQETIAKAMKEIADLSKDPGKNANQLTRWVMNKEDHASKIQQTMLDYFLAQRLKTEEMESDKEAYLDKLALCHNVIVLAMKCKQTADPENATKLHAAIDKFATAYSAAQAKKG